MGEESVRVVRSEVSILLIVATVSLLLRGFSPASLASPSPPAAKATPLLKIGGSLEDWLQHHILRSSHLGGLGVVKHLRLLMVV